MNDIIFRPFDKQLNILNSQARVKGAFAGKRGAKSETGAIQSIIWQENKLTNRSFEIDPYCGLIVAPTYDMLNRLSWKKFNAYAKPFIKEQTKSPKYIRWHDDSEVYGVSADRPERMEGMKIDWVWVDEIFQVNEHTFLELQARVADTMGFMLLTGSLGVQYVNPRSHWVYKYFKENKHEGFECFEWATADNPYFPREELTRLKNTLDKTTFDQMFTINWDVNSQNMVYSDFSDQNLIEDYKYNKSLPTFIAIDWGWTHPMACLFFQYDQFTDTVYQFDEIVGSRIKIEDLYDTIMGRGYDIAGWCCDISGTQEREQTGISNIQWFNAKPRNVRMRIRSTAILYGVSIVRSYVKTVTGNVRYKLDYKKCPETYKGIKRYRYPEDEGKSNAELPVKQDDDAMDALRYFFVNFIDKALKDNQSETIQL